MAWNDRLQTAAYTSPSGRRLEFEYVDVGYSADRKTSAYEAPGSDGTYVQDLGTSSRRYPFEIFFSGDDYDLRAQEFETALTEPGVGKLEHPIYGTINVVPFGAISRRDSLTTGANQCRFDVTFWQTIDTVYPLTQVDPAGEVLAAVEAYNATAAGSFNVLTDLDSAVEQATFENQYLDLLNATALGLAPIAATTDIVRSQFDAIYQSINIGIDTLIADPLTLAFQTVQLIQSPARATAAVGARLSAYADLTTAIITGDSAVSSPGLDSFPENSFQASDLYASTYVTGSILSSVNNEFDTKVDALLAAEQILDQLAQLTQWRDENYSSLGIIDTGEAYQQLQNAAALAAGFLVQISFSLKQERRVTLPRPRTIVDLVAELYGGVDEFLDFFINTNSLTGSEILELPAGREIVYYV